MARAMAGHSDMGFVGDGCRFWTLTLWYLVPVPGAGNLPSGQYPFLASSNHGDLPGDAVHGVLSGPGLRPLSAPWGHAWQIGMFGE